MIPVVRRAYVASIISDIINEYEYELNIVDEMWFMAIYEHVFIVLYILYNNRSNEDDDSY